MFDPDPILIIEGVGGEVDIVGTTDDEEITINRDIARKAEMVNLSSPSIYISITLNNFDKFTAHGGGQAGDVAYMGDSDADGAVDIFTAHPTWATMQGPLVDISVYGFSTIHGYRPVDHLRRQRRYR